MNSSSTYHSELGLDGVFLNVGFRTFQSIAPCLAYGLAATLATILNSQHARYHGVLASIWTTLNSPALTTSIAVSILTHITTGILTQSLRNTPKELTQREQNADSNTRRCPDHDLKPLLFPACTTHRRLFPTPHSFSYSYLLAGIPVDNSIQSDNSLLSSHRTESEPSAWFSVYATDYLIRGSSLNHLSFRQRLNEYLESQGVDPTDIQTAYLVTAPRFLGFSFNPVSFWYLYSKAGHFSAMILEVNNTFDERRMYFLHRSESDITDCPKFTFTWKKDFHVSPFNDRDGSYSVSAVDVRTGVVDVTIVLRDDAEKPKIVARVFSTPSTLAAGRSIHDTDVGLGVDPTILFVYSKIRFLCRWSWVGFFTNPRILREARILWSKKLQVFYRPEPRLGTIGRNETEEEVIMEEVFARILQNLAGQTGFAFLYQSAAGLGRGRARLVGTGAQVVLTVLTPEFYAEMARSKSVLDLFERVVFRSDSDGEKLAYVSDEKVMCKMLVAESGMAGRLAGNEGPCSSPSRKAGDEMFLGDVEFLAERHERHGRQWQSLVKRYLWARRRILLADRIAFGSCSFLAIELRLFRGAAVFILTGVAMRVVSRTIS